MKQTERNGFTKVEILLALLLVATTLCAAIPVYKIVHQNIKVHRCEANIQKISTELDRFLTNSNGKRMHFDEACAAFGVDASAYEDGAQTEPILESDWAADFKNNLSESVLCCPLGNTCQDYCIILKNQNGSTAFEVLCTAEHQK